MHLENCEDIAWVDWAHLVNCIGNVVRSAQLEIVSEEKTIITKKIIFLVMKSVSSSFGINSKHSQSERSHSIVIQVGYESFGSAGSKV